MISRTLAALSVLALAGAPVLPQASKAQEQPKMVWLKPAEALAAARSKDKPVCWYFGTSAAGPKGGRVTSPSSFG